VQRSVRRDLGRAISVVAASISILAVGATSAVHVPDGPLALVAVLLSHMLLGAAALALLAVLLERGRWAAMAAVLVLALFGVRLSPEWLSLPPAAGTEPEVTVLSWNLEVGSRAPSTMADVILEHDADIVALQEVTPEAADALEATAAISARYPYRIFVPDPSVLGMAVLSAYPIIDSAAIAIPPMLEVTVELGDGRTLRVLDAHPLPGTIDIASTVGLPVGFDGTRRDLGLRVVRDRIDELVRTGDPVIVIGDFNVAPTEHAYGWLAAGLRDVHAEVGVGPGWTWRPSRLESLGMGLLRIDYVFVSPQVRPAGIALDCSQPGDHCLVGARFGVP
jgi:endonuclease/exonuclease/phosphatase (EEP) superfamily protein YafD